MKSARLLFLVFLLSPTPLFAATPAQHPSASTVPVLMLSDIHLDPFHDPAKLSQLRTTPVSGWAAILYGPPSPTQTADFTHLQSTCGARGIDTPPALLRSSLHAEHTQQPRPLFVTVSGDLLAHQFACRFHTLAPAATEADYSAFAARTIAFIALQLRQTFPASPIYFALGNNDSGCNDYREDPNSAFLHADAASFAADAISPANRSAILHQFPNLGDDNIALPAPIQHTRLLVLQDIFESKKYAACNGDSSDTPATQQIAWLRTQLTAARAAHEHVWIMAHIPPGIDAYSTFTKHRNVCAGQSPQMFLSSDALAQTIAGFPDVIRLALFAHTHMDEFRVFKAAPGSPNPDAIIPGKLVPSITPVNGNNPAFTLAQVEPHTATLKDYTVYSATSPTGTASSWGDKATEWHKEYTYSTTYHFPDLSGPSLAKLTNAFIADKSGAAETSQAYQQYFYVGDPGISASLKAAAMQLVWPTYACAIVNASPESFRTCACPAAP